MTEPRRSRSTLRTTPLVLAVVALTGVLFSCRMPRPAVAQRPTEAQRALVYLTSVGLDSVGPSPTVLIYTSGGGRAGIGRETPKTLTDTLRLASLPAMTLDVTDGDVHIRLVGPGRVRVAGHVTGGPATHLSGEGRELILVQGGVGIRTR